MRGKIWLIAIILVAVLLGANNTIYYFTTKNTLESQLESELESTAKQIELSIELSRIGAEAYQQQIGRELRAAAIAAQYALDPDIENVTNEQLKELSEKLGIAHITLMKKTPDNIVLYKSSDPHEIGVKTSTWNPWYMAFQQLLSVHNVTIPWGQSLPNFWTGPFELATSDTSQINKWGYYNDGTTNYIIDPFIRYNDRQLEYDQKTGVDGLISKTLENNETLLEIAVINPSTFPLGPQITTTEAGDQLEHRTQQPIIYGAYEYAYSEDMDLIAKVSKSNELQTVNTTINGKHVLKMYLPVSMQGSASIVDENGDPLTRYVLTLTADYQSIQDALDHQFFSIALIMIVVTIISLIVAFLVVTSYRKSQDKLARAAQETYVDEINGLFQAIRAQRHDFMNHVQTIHSLAQLGKIDDLKAYSAELTGEIRQMNDMINIGNPAIAALIRSKMSQAEALKIELTIRLEDMNKLALGVKSLDLTRVLGNLIDNAFDEVMLLPEEERNVTVGGTLVNGYLEFTVSNSCSDLSFVQNNPIFKSGFSTKGEGHSGLGLSIVKSIVESYKGSVQVNTETISKIAFIVRIPH
ncbi:flagellar basal body-associated protein FliL [Paenibacillus phyllosphaerae]|uniref:Flagellar basal body-associated protein FliL n=1 Tax=Paenibacillus phyllosphaerae TaxID=274593 RepID=A0A7W5B379_9BACL|nr:GHKL domain-containing protein [Paenibacillus phyllosphaerae]MBB3113602.1 flagellar basal body-associated protein FliL [Paenibacillus phyllosphaerae]